MNRREHLAGVGAAGLLGLTSAVRAQPAAPTFPTRPIVMYNGYAPGGSTDIAARLMIEGLSRSLGGQNVLVENRPGASGTVAAAFVRRQPADGYGLLLSESSSFAIWPAMQSGWTSYDPVKDFDWVATVCTAPLVLLAKPGLPRDPAALMELLRSPRSAQLDYSSSGAGSIPHIASEMFRGVLGSGNQSRHVPYRGGSPAVLSIAAGETAWGAASLGSAIGQVQGNAVQAVAVTSPQRFPLLPDVPSFTELGLQAMELDIYYLVQAPLGLPPAVLRTLNEACAASLTQPAAQERFLKAGMKVWSGTNAPEGARAVVEAELARFREIGRRTGIQITG